MTLETKKIIAVLSLIVIGITGIFAFTSKSKEDKANTDDQNLVNENGLPVDPPIDTSPYIDTKNGGYLPTKVCSCPTDYMYQQEPLKGCFPNKQLVPFRSDSVDYKLQGNSIILTAKEGAVLDEDTCKSSYNGTFADSKCKIDFPDGYLTKFRTDSSFNGTTETWFYLLCKD